MPPLATLSRSRPLLDVVSAQAGTGASALLGEARELAEGWGGEALGRGEAVAVALPNGDEWLRTVLALAVCGARPLLLAADTPAAELARVLDAAGGWRHAAAGGSLVAVREAPAGLTDAHADADAIGLLTSGSTGERKIVWRSDASLVAEGERYRRTLELGPHDRVVVLPPLSHAYALGWLFAILVSGARFDLLPATALGAAVDRVVEGATILVLVPSLARLLARRGADGRSVRSLRLAMVGAGPVDAALDDAFTRGFGIGLARNYGSTETGATLAGEPPLPPLTVGRPLPGVAVRFAGATAENGAGHLHVRVEGRWHETGDLARERDGGVIEIVGRLGRALRRGDRWVSPAEIEEVLRRCPGVRDAHVVGRSGRHAGDERIFAFVVADDPATLATEAILEHARTELAPWKVPDRVLVRTTLRRNEVGKVVSAPVYRLAARERVAAAARAYKLSELVFALARLGVLDALDGATEAAVVAAQLGLQADELEIALEVAEALGVVERTADAAAPATEAPRPLIALEEELSRTLVTREALVDVLVGGVHRRRFDREPLADGLRELYVSAMHDADAPGRARLALRLARFEPGERVVEVTVGPGVYAAATAAAGSATALVQLGRLSPATAPAGVDCRDPADVEAAAWDLCVVSNAVHESVPPHGLDWIVGLLRDGGRLLVDDVFVPEEGEGAELALDWLTHGSTAWRSLADLESALRTRGLVVDRRVPLGNGLRQIAIVRRDE